MKKLTTKQLTIFFTITLTLSLIGIISYLSSNPYAGDMYFTRNNSYHTPSNNSYGWLDNIPFISNELKDYVQSEIDDAMSEIDDAIHESITSVTKQTNTPKNRDTDWNWNSNHNSTKHTKVSDTITNNFPTSNIEEMEIITDISRLSFVEEDRSDVKVEYIYTKPDTTNFTISYDTEVKSNTLLIEQHINTRNYSGNMSHYQNNITVYVPKGFKVDKIKYHNNLGKIIDNTFYSNAKVLDLYTSLGGIDISLSDDVSSVTLSSSKGDVTIDNSADIDDLRLLTNSGIIRLENTGTINTLTMNSDKGDVTVNSEGKVNTSILHVDKGNIVATYKEEVDSFSVTCDMGNIDLTLFGNDNTTIDTKVDVGKVSSDFTEGNSQDYIVKCDVGNITVRKK